MAGYKVEICGVNTSKLPMLKEEEKEELFVLIKAKLTIIFFIISSFKITHSSPLIIIKYFIHL